MGQTVHIIAGPTASGKTAFGIELAAQIKAEQKQESVIINADSMQIYNALPVLTAQPDTQERSAVEHRLYGTLDPAINCTAIKWRDLAIQEIKNAFESGKQPILVGGTGFYMQTLTDGLSPIPEVDPDIHAAVLQQSEDIIETLYQELQKIDPELARRLNPADKQRIARGVEVFRSSGIPLSQWQKQPLIPPPHDWAFEITVLRPDRAWLHKRINTRVPKMLELGALEEVKALAHRIEKGDIPETAGVVKAHGFRAFRRYLRNETSLEDAIDYTQTETRQYAKRQDTWFGNQLLNLDTNAHARIKRVTAKTLP